MTASPKSLESAEMREYERMRAALAYAIADEKAYAADVFVPTQRGAKAPVPTSPLEAASDYKMYRQRYQTIQQAMETNIAKLRGSLRAILATQTPERARLAVVDAILERSLSVQERRLMAAIPGLLEKHFKHLRQEAQAAEQEAAARAAQAAADNTAPTQDPAREPDEAAETSSTGAAPSSDAPPAPPPAPAAKTMTRTVPLANTRFMANRANKPVAPVIPPWLAAFRRDMRSVLLAELDIRLQPIEGLLAALRAS